MYIQSKKHMKMFFNSKQSQKSNKIDTYCLHNLLHEPQIDKYSNLALTQFQLLHSPIVSNPMQEHVFVKCLSAWNL